MKTPAFKDSRTLEAQVRQDKSPNSANYLGTRGGHLDENSSILETAQSEIRFAGNNGQHISLIRDTPGAIGTGYGAQTGAGTIVLGVGYNSDDPISTTKRSSQTGGDIKPVFSVRDNKRVAAQIYISQKTDADIDFFADGTVGETNAKSAITYIADTHRMWGKEGIKFITGVGDDQEIKNSKGAPIRSVGRFDFIAGNDDTNISPVAKAGSLSLVVEDLYQQADKSNSLFDSFNTAQLEFNGQITTHDHLDLTVMLVGLLAYGNPFAINGGKGLPSPELIAGGMKCLPQQYVLKIDALMQKLQNALAVIYGTNPAGPDNPASPSFFTT